MFNAMPAGTVTPRRTERERERERERGGGGGGGGGGGWLRWRKRENRVLF